MKKLRLQRYTLRHQCFSCKAFLSWWAKQYSHGVCGACGAYSGDTVVKTRDEVGQWSGFLWWRTWHPRIEGEQ